MKKTLDTIIGENGILLHISTICYITDVSNKLNKNLSVISLSWLVF